MQRKNKNPTPHQSASPTASPRGEALDFTNLPVRTNLTDLQKPLGSPKGGGKGARHSALACPNPQHHPARAGQATPLRYDELITPELLRRFPYVHPAQSAFGSAGLSEAARLARGAADRCGVGRQSNLPQPCHRLAAGGYAAPRAHRLSGRSGGAARAGGAGGDAGYAAGAAAGADAHVLRRGGRLARVGA